MLVNNLQYNQEMSKIIIDGKKYERIKVKGKENCNDCDLAKNVRSLASVPICWQEGNEKIIKYCENHPDVIYKEVKP